MFVDVEQAGVGVNCLPQGQGLYVQDNLRVNGKRLIQKFDMNLKSLSTEMFYPVTFAPQRERIDCEIYSVGGNADSPWNQNSISFSATWTGWSDTPKTFNVHNYRIFDDTAEVTIGCIGGGAHAGVFCVWLRGGLEYHFCSNVPASYHINDYTYSDEVFTVGANYYGGANTNVDILFTPRSTIWRGDYIWGLLRASGDIRGGTLTSDGAIAAAGQITGSFIKASGNTEAGADIVARNGYLYAFGNSRYVRVGCENGSHAHYVTDATDSHWFNKAVRVAGALYKGSGYNVNVPGIYVQSSQPGATQTGDIWVI